MLRSHSLKTLTLLTVLAVGFFLFQGQSARDGYRDKPYIDHVPDPYLNGIINPHPPQPSVVVTVNGYDNWHIGNDFAEPHMTVNPRNPTNFFNAFNINTGHRTLDGINWNTFTPLVPNSAGDPWTTADSLGNIYYETMKSPITGCWVIKSTDGGNTWSSAVTGVAGGDRNTMVADQTNGPYKGYIYSAMTGTSYNNANFWRSTDYGATFTQTFGSITPHNLPGVHIAVGPNGTIQGGAVYLVTYSGSNASGTYTFWLSTDGGTSFTQRSQISGIGIIGTEISNRSTINGARARPYPWIAADQSYGQYRGRLYLVYANNPNGVNGLKSDVYLRYSTDMGASWSTPVVVNDDPNTQTTNQWFPSIWCEKETGKLWINWYDMRNDPNNIQTDVYATYTTTGGTSFVPNQRVTNASWNFPGSSCSAPCYKGDYHMIAANETTSLSVWMDGRVGTTSSFVGYFPDFALTTSSTAITVGQNDSGFVRVAIPSTKLYTDKAKFTVTSNPPASGFSLSFVRANNNIQQDSLTAYPDSLRLRIKTLPSFTPGTYTLTVKVAGSNGTPVHTRDISLSTIVGLNTLKDGVPQNFYLYQNYPNPFNPSTQITFDMPKAGLVKLSVFDVNGKLIKTLVNGNVYAGKQTVFFNADNLSSGIYFYKIETDGYSSIRKMMLVK